MKIREITDLIESVAPLDLQLDFDNSGMLVGDKNNEVTKVLVAVDVTSGAVDKAIEIGANLIVSHHPIIFYPTKNILADDVMGGIVTKAIKHDIALYAAHTNFDNAKGGITETILSRLGVIDICALEDDGTGRVAIIKPMRLGDIQNKLFEITGDKTMRVQGNEDRLITKLALINGAGGRDESLAAILKAKGVELFITGETKHSFALLLKELNIALIDIEHYHAERIFNDMMCELISASHVEIEKYNDTNPYNS